MNRQLWCFQVVTNFYVLSQCLLKNVIQLFCVKAKIRRVEACPGNKSCALPTELCVNLLFSQCRPYTLTMRMIRFQATTRGL